MKNWKFIQIFSDSNFGINLLIIDFRIFLWNNGYETDEECCLQYRLHRFRHYGYNSPISHLVCHIKSITVASCMNLHVLAIFAISFPGRNVNTLAKSSGGRLLMEIAIFFWIGSGQNQYFKKLHVVLFIVDEATPFTLNQSKVRHLHVWPMTWMNAWHTHKLCILHIHTLNKN